MRSEKKSKITQIILKIVKACFSLALSFTLFLVIFLAVIHFNGGLFGGTKIHKNRPPDAKNFPVSATLECEKYYWLDVGGLDHAWYGFLFLTDAELSRLKEEYEWTEVSAVYVELEKEDYQLTAGEETEEMKAILNSFEDPKSALNALVQPIKNNAGQMSIPFDLTKQLEPYEEFDWRHSKAFSDEFTVPFTFGPAYLDIKNGIIYFYCYTM